MDVDQARRDVQAGDVHDLEGGLGIDALRDSGNLAVLDRDVTNRADVVSGVDDVPALEHEIVLLRVGRIPEAQQESEDEERTGHELLRVSVFAEWYAGDDPLSYVLVAKINSHVAKIATVVAVASRIALRRGSMRTLRANAHHTRRGGKPVAACATPADIPHLPARLTTPVGGGVDRLAGGDWLRRTTDGANRWRKPLSRLRGWGGHGVSRP